MPQLRVPTVTSLRFFRYCYRFCFFFCLTGHFWRSLHVRHGRQKSPVEIASAVRHSIRFRPKPIQLNHRWMKLNNNVYLILRHPVYPSTVHSHTRTQRTQRSESWSPIKVQFSSFHFPKEDKFTCFDQNHSPYLFYT